MGAAFASNAAGATLANNIDHSGILKSTANGLRIARGGVTVTLDADGQHDPADIEKLVEPNLRGKVDLVLGRREEEVSASEYAHIETN